MQLNAILSSSLTCSSLACKQIMELKWWTQPFNQFLEPYLFVFWSYSLEKQACQVSQIWRRLLCPPPFLCTLQLIPYFVHFQLSILQPLHLLEVLSCPSLGWADFTAQAQGVWGCVTHVVVPVGCTLPNTWRCCIVTRPCVEDPRNWNSRYYERSGKAWENQKLKGLKFPRLIYPLLFPKINQCPRGFSSPGPD